MPRCGWYTSQSAYLDLDLDPDLDLGTSSKKVQLSTHSDNFIQYTGQGFLGSSFECRLHQKFEKGSRATTIYQ